MARIQVSHLTFAYEGSPDLIFDDASFSLDTDWKLGFIARNGRGKTTLLKILCGKLPDHGAVSASTQFDYFPFAVPDPSKTPLMKWRGTGTLLFTNWLNYFVYQRTPYDLPTLGR